METYTLVEIHHPTKGRMLVRAGTEHEHLSTTIHTEGSHEGHEEGQGEGQGEGVLTVPSAVAVAASDTPPPDDSFPALVEAPTTAPLTIPEAPPLPKKPATPLPKPATGPARRAGRTT